MNWQTFAITTCLMWGVSGVLSSRAAGGQPATVSFVIYSGVMFLISLAVAATRLREVSFERTSALLMVCSGLLAGTGALLQLTAFARWNQQAPWIILITSLYPAVVLVVALFGGARFSNTQWLGIVFACVAIVLISAPRSSTP